MLGLKMTSEVSLLSASHPTEAVGAPIVTYTIMNLDVVVECALFPEALSSTAFKETNHNFIHTVRGRVELIGNIEVYVSRLSVLVSAYHLL